ncbi:MAG: methylenetetrahydrofolate reductase [NAD(P)H] [Pseudomonadales bacterium]
MDSLVAGKRLSFEFFPPKSEQGLEKLRTVWRELSRLEPEFFSITYGAGGSTRSTTYNIVEEFSKGPSGVAPHLSFGVDDEAIILELLQRYADLGVDRIVALRGDTPSGIGSNSQMVFASELVTFIRQHFADQFHLEVAAYPEAHPEARSLAQDVGYLKQKLDCGAHSAITQLFYSTDAYYYFVDECRRQGIKQDIYPGIMPVTNFINLSRFAGKSGFDIPRWMQQKFEPYKDDVKATTQLGIETVSRLCEQLLNSGAPGIHFYTMNTVSPTTQICENLGWRAS